MEQVSRVTLPNTREIRKVIVDNDTLKKLSFLDKQCINIIADVVAAFFAEKKLELLEVAMGCVQVMDKLSQGINIITERKTFRPALMAAITKYQWSIIRNMIQAILLNEDEAKFLQLVSYGPVKSSRQCVIL